MMIEDGIQAQRDVLVLYTDAGFGMFEGVWTAI